MADRPILILASPSVQPGASPAWVEQVVCAWREPRPIVRRVTLEMLNDGAFRLERETVIALWLGQGASRASVCQAFDGAARTHVPVVALAERPAEIAAMAPAGVVTRHWHADPAKVAVTLQTLIERQPALEELASDQARMLTAQTSLANQMEQMQEELALASQIQQELIPRHGPTIEGLELAVICRPAGYVSGDLFDVRALDRDHVGFFLADAVGHGVPAALFTLLIARSLRQMDDGRILPPGEVLRRLNADMLERNATGSRFATAVYGVLNLSEGKAEIAGAGHPAPIIARSTGFERVETSGPLLGIFEEAEFDQVQIRLGRMDSIVIFTDGFEVAFPSASEDAYSLKLPTRDYIEHLAAFGRDCRESHEMDAAVRRFERSLDGQLGSLHQPDDLTALVLAPATERMRQRSAA